MAFYSKARSLLRSHSTCLVLIITSFGSLSAQSEMDEPWGLGNYYVCESGNDSLKGNSPEQAWKSIEKINSISFSAGDVVHFKGGQIFKGSLVLDENDAGEDGKPVVFTSYGEGRAMIDAGDACAFSLTGNSYTQIKKLKLRGSGRKKGNTANGMSFTNCSHINIDSLDVSGFQHSGIVFNAYGNNNRITHVNAFENGYAGILVNGVWGDKSSQSDIYIAYCQANNNPGDPTVTNNHSGNGILVFVASDVTIEYCEASNNGWDLPWTGNGPGGIWVAEVDRATIQYCISHDNKTSSGKDGVGFDLDGGTRNSVIQYCLSYNNMGSGYGIFEYESASEWANNTIRYCISENDGNESAEGSIGIWNGRLNNNYFHDLHFYNNVVYNTDGRSIFFTDHHNESFYFRNNVFVSSGEFIYGGIGGETFQSNCWYSLSDETSDFEKFKEKVAGFYAHPEFLSPGNSSLSDPTRLSGLRDYLTKSSSLLINSGLDLLALFGTDPGARDFAGNPIPGGGLFDIGAYENDVADGILKQGADQECFVFPNPNSDGIVQIRLPGSGIQEEYQLSLVDVMGRVVRTREICIPGKQEITFDLGPDLAPEYYLLKIQASHSPAFVRPLIIMSK